jgi:Cu/Ag efflux pump CusA
MPACNGELAVHLGINLTTIASRAGMLPVARKTGADAEFGAPMAIAVIGGWLGSTVPGLIYRPPSSTRLSTIWSGARHGVRSTV